jgi:hypothetical protein
MPWKPLVSPSADAGDPSRPATVVVAPEGATLRTSLFPASATYRFSSASRAMPWTDKAVGLGGEAAEKAALTPAPSA